MDINETLNHVILVLFTFPTWWSNLQFLPGVQ